MMGVGEATSVVSPGEDAKAWEDERDDQKLDRAKAREYRGLAARANCLVFDTPGRQYAVNNFAAVCLAQRRGAERS